MASDVPRLAGLRSPAKRAFRATGGRGWATRCKVQDHGCRLPKAPETACYTARVLASNTHQGGPAVSLYVMLNSLSESGRKVLRERPGWIKKVNADVQRMGARVVAQYAVLGPYDFVTIVEAPDNATISRVSVELGARGGVAGMTLAAIPLDEFIERLERGGKRQGKKKR
jgi:uncharacterized protein with GYD domain